MKENKEKQILFFLFLRKNKINFFFEKFKSSKIKQIKYRQEIKECKDK